MKYLLIPSLSLLLLFSCKKDPNDAIDPGTVPIYRTFSGEIGVHDNSTLTTLDNNLLICGNLSDKICLIKISKIGAQLWRKEFAAKGGFKSLSIAESDHQDIFICSSTKRNDHISQYDVLLIKTNSKGDTLWTKTYGGIKEDYGYYIIPTADGNLLLGGISYSYTPDGYCDIYLIKVNTNGDTLWTRTFPEPDQEIPFHLMQTQNGDYLITGTNQDNNSNRELYLLKVSAAGIQLWNKKIGPPVWKWGLATIELSNGDLMNCGNITINGQNQILLIKTDGQGNVYWEKNYGDDFLSEQGTSIQANIDGSFMITGNSYDVHSGDYQIVLLKVDQNGDQVFLNQYGGNFSDGGVNLLKDDNDENIITGEYNGNIFMTRADNNGVFK